MTKLRAKVLPRLFTFASIKQILFSPLFLKRHVQFMFVYRFNMTIMMTSEITFTMIVELQICSKNICLLKWDLSFQIHQTLTIMFMQCFHSAL